MTQTNATPATKLQLDSLIQMCIDGGFNEAAGLLKLGSETLSGAIRESEKPVFCSCYDYAGENPACKIHGDLFDNHGAFSDAEIKADYQERNDLYTMGMGA